MILKEFLLTKNVDIDSNKSVLANQLKADLSSQDYHIDFNKDTDDLSEEDIYQIGRSLLLPNFSKAFQKSELIERMKKDIIQEKSK
jgi:hypothetical protein